MVRTYKLYNTASASADAAATFAVLRQGTIVGCQLSYCLSADADCLGAVEVSRRPTNQITTTSTLPADVLAEARIASNITTTGQQGNGVSVFVPQSIPVGINERIYLHYSQTGTGTGFMSAILFIDER